MKNKLKLLLTLITIVVTFLPSFEQIPNLSGTWRLNLAKSKLENVSNGFTGSIFIIKQDSNKFHLTRYHLFGKKKNKLSFNMVADNKTRRVKIFFKGKLEIKGSSLEATLWRKNFLNIVNYKFGTTENELVADEVYTGTPQNHHNIWVFDKEVKNLN